MRLYLKIEPHIKIKSPITVPMILAPLLVVELVRIVQDAGQVATATGTGSWRVR